MPLTSDIVDGRVDVAARLLEAFPGLTIAGARPGARIDAPPRLGLVILLGSRRAPEMAGRELHEPCAPGLDRASRTARRAALDANRAAVPLCTSGTTATPTDRPIAHHRPVGVTREFADSFGVQAGDRSWDGLSMFHASSLLRLLASLSAAWGRARPSRRRRRPRLGPRWRPATGSPRALACPSRARSRTRPRSAPQRSAGRPLRGVEVEICDPASGLVSGPDNRRLRVLPKKSAVTGSRNAPGSSARAFDAPGWFAAGDLVFPTRQAGCSATVGSRTR